MYEDEELRPYLVDPHKQTLIDLQYHVEKLKAYGHELLIFMDANQAEEEVYQAQTQNDFFLKTEGFSCGWISTKLYPELWADQCVEANVRRCRP
jgi:hypothetical protein